MGTLQDASLVKLVKDVYKSSWSEFYLWEQDHCLQTLHSLARPLPEENIFAATASGSHKSSTPSWHSSPSTEEALPQNVHEENFVVVDYSTTDRDPESTIIPAKIVELSRPLEPSAPYEFCTPINRNINVGDDSEYMPFIPLIDDPEFDYIPHTEDYKYFAWQLPDRDPDLEVIMLRAIHTLYHTHHLSTQDIDATQVFSLPVISGILNSTRRRDFPNWFFPNPPLPYIPSHDSTSVTNFSNLVHDFCHSANCVIGYCTVHLGEMPMPAAVPPTLSNDALTYSVTSPCGQECFLLGKTSLIGTFWDDSDAQALNTTLSFTPDLSPCELSIICRKPCREIFQRRKHILPDVASAKQLAKSRLNRNINLQFEDYDSAIFTPDLPCSHAGPCDGQVNCPCFSNNAHCERTCRCDQRCPRRWRGCACAKSKSHTTCRTARCSCYRARRECDPDACLKCEARSVSDDGCRNSQLQHSGRKKTQVRQSKWGLGLYIVEDAVEDDLIVEYTGELLYEITTICRDFVSRHRGRNYLFQLNSTLSIDSSKAGNDSRFINHDSINANCVANVKLVNGEHRIGIFAFADTGLARQITAGSELLLNYGGLFFPSEVESIGTTIENNVERKDSTDGTIERVPTRQIFKIVQ